VTFVSQYDIELVLAIEKATGVKMTALEGVDEEAVLRAMGKVTTARQMAKLRLAETGFETKIAQEKARNEEQRKAQQEFLEKKDADGSSDEDAEGEEDVGTKADPSRKPKAPASSAVRDVGVNTPKVKPLNKKSQSGGRRRSAKKKTDAVRSGKKQKQVKRKKAKRQRTTE